MTLKTNWRPVCIRGSIASGTWNEPAGFDGRGKGLMHRAAEGEAAPAKGGGAFQIGVHLERADFLEGHGIMDGFLPPEGTRGGDSGQPNPYFKGHALF